MTGLVSITKEPTERTEEKGERDDIDDQTTPVKSLFFTLPSDHIYVLLFISPSLRTTLRAWTSILNDTEALSRDRQLYSEALITRVYDPLKGLATKKDDARKKVSSS